MSPKKLHTAPRKRISHASGCAGNKPALPAGQPCAITILPPVKPSLSEIECASCTVIDAQKHEAQKIEAQRNAVPENEVLKENESEEVSNGPHQNQASANHGAPEKAINPVYSPTLEDFVRMAWTHLEPVSPLVWNWHLDLICDYLTLIRSNGFKPTCGKELEGIIFNVPPRTMKSLLISVFFPIWVWTVDPARRFMFVSYSEKLSTQHSVYRRSLIESEWYQERWGKVFRLSRDQNVKSHYENSRRGTMFSTGMQATATGMGGDILIFDDPLNPEQAISQAEREAVNVRFDTTFRSRINDPATGIKIIIMQRLHELDLTGHVLARESPRWEHVSLPAIAQKDKDWKFPISKKTVTQKAGDLLWPQRLTESFLASQRVGMGSWAFNGQYQQTPAPLDGGIIKRAWVRFYRELPAHFDFMVQSWDCTFSGGSDNDFVAGQVWGRSGGKYYMLPYRAYERLDFGPTMAAIKSAHAKFPSAHAVLIEDKANGPAIISELQKEIPGVVAVNPEGGKIARAQATAPLWEAGSIELPDPQIFGTTWMEDYLHNICAFPKAAHDDDMDATSQALIYMRSRLGGGIVDFYRQQASMAANAGAITAAIAGGQGKLPGTGNHSGTRSYSGTRNYSETRRAALQRSSGDHVAMTDDNVLPHDIIEAVTQGSQIHCNARQYPEIRAALLNAISSPTGPSDEMCTLFINNEIQRLDLLFEQDYR
ncbi:MAG TPA: phage terminase large subunit [Candidatus Angelobacter sp.]|nr:phage terminase large subunit [Candidatus Angelobacter sp.]